MPSLSLPGHSLSIHAAPAAGGNAAIAHTSPAVWLSADRGLGTTGARQFVAANKLHMLPARPTSTPARRTSGSAGG